MIDDFILIIPARLESTRLPKKLLIRIDGLSIIQRTYNCALNALRDKEKINQKFQIKKAASRKMEKDW